MASTLVEIPITADWIKPNKQNYLGSNPVPFQSGINSLFALLLFAKRQLGCVHSKKFSKCLRLDQ